MYYQYTYVSTAPSLNLSLEGINKTHVLNAFRTVLEKWDVGRRLNGFGDLQIMRR